MDTFPVCLAIDPILERRRNNWFDTNLLLIHADLGISSAFVSSPHVQPFQLPHDERTEPKSPAVCRPNGVICSRICMELSSTTLFELVRILCQIHEPDAVNCLHVSVDPCPGLSFSLALHFAESKWKVRFQNRRSCDDTGERHK